MAESTIKARSAVFDGDNDRNPVKLARQMEVIRGEDGRETIAFQTMSERGVGTNQIPAEEWDGFVEALEHFVENPPEEEVLPKLAGEKVLHTMQLITPTGDDGAPTGEEPYYQYKLTSGRGSKPCRIPANYFGEVVELLESVNVERALDKFHRDEKIAADKARKIAAEKAEKEAKAAAKTGGASTDGAGASTDPAASSK